MFLDSCHSNYCPNQHLLSVSTEPTSLPEASEERLLDIIEASYPNPITLEVTHLQEKEYLPHSYCVLGDMQQLHKRGEGSPAHAFGTAAPEEDPDNGEQPQCLHQVGLLLCSWTLDETIDAIIPRVQRDQENIVVVKQMPRVGHTTELTVFH